MVHDFRWVDVIFKAAAFDKFLDLDETNGWDLEGVDHANLLKSGHFVTSVHLHEEGKNGAKLELLVTLSGY